jgi:hypothetical protein
MKVMTDEIIELYMRDVDRTLLRENLKLTPTQRFEQLMELQRFAEELRRAGRRIPDGPRAMAELKALLQEKAKGS